MPGRGNPKRPPFDRPPPRTAPPDPAGRSQARGRGPPASTRSPQARPCPKIRQAADTGAASPPPPLRSCTRRGPMRHRPSRPIDLSRGAASSSAHGLQICACFARSPRMVQLVSALLRQAARSSPVVNGRTERRPIEAASRQRRWALGLSGRIAAGGPWLPLSAALGVECSVRVSAPTISASSMKVAGNKYGSAVYLLNCVTGSHNTLQVCTSVSATLPTS